MALTAQCCQQKSKAGGCQLPVPCGFLCFLMSLCLHHCMVGSMGGWLNDSLP